MEKQGKVYVVSDPLSYILLKNSIDRYDDGKLGFKCLFSLEALDLFKKGTIKHEDKILWDKDNTTFLQAEEEMKTLREKAILSKVGVEKGRVVIESI